MKVKPDNLVAMSATLHCLTGCAIGEISGLILGTIFGWSNLTTIVVAITLAFAIGYTLSLLPLVKSGLKLTAAMRLVLAADTLSIFTMEVVDNAVILVIPGAMSNGIVNPLFWATLSMALFIAYWAAFPVNKYLIARGKGHALVHEYHHNM
jgi:predicted Abi (CAAX) family protease